MSISSNRKELFRSSTIEDKFILFQLLLDTKDLTAGMALALLKVIHDEVSNQQQTNGFFPKRYALLFASLRYHVPEIFQQVTENWKAYKSPMMPAEWFDDNKNFN